MLHAAASVLLPQTRGAPAVCWVCSGHGHAGSVNSLCPRGVPSLVCGQERRAPGRVTSGGGERRGWGGPQGPRHPAWPRHGEVSEAQRSLRLAPGSHRAGWRRPRLFFPGCLPAAPSCHAARVLPGRPSRKQGRDHDFPLREEVWRCRQEVAGVRSDWAATWLRGTRSACLSPGLAVSTASLAVLGERGGRWRLIPAPGRRAEGRCGTSCVPGPPGRRRRVRNTCPHSESLAGFPAGRGGVLGQAPPLSGSQRSFH